MARLRGRTGKLAGVDGEGLRRVVLSSEERAVLCAGLSEWGGPATPTDGLAAVMGLGDLSTIYTETNRLRDALERDEALSAEDWRRVLLATEIVFASDVVGSGLDWSITTGFRDEETIRLLRGLQRKLPRWRATYQFDVKDDGEVEIRDPGRDV